ncbi:hypothetical protein HPP92_015189 [Vanilla planifolia]|uniref:Uncharacterized protein n=1 Tax=Vanilla planifolia TaxID=51239 RepID=A0A835UTF4_VANPL|nr:hypothetical protein HPP92_015189 [Vanilla planifolia]
MAGKAKLLSFGGFANCYHLQALLIAFLMRLPMAAFIPVSLPYVARPLRSVLCRLRGFLFRGTPAEINQRLGRTIRMLHNRVIDSRRSLLAEEDAETLLALSMSSL